MAEKSMRLEYIRKLIEVLGAGDYLGEKGHDLMDRIEEQLVLARAEEQEGAST